MGMQPRCVQIPTNTPNSGLIERVPVGRVGWLLYLLGIRIGKQGNHLRALHGLQNFRRPVEHEDRVLSPPNDDLGSFRNFVDVDIDRPPGSQCRSVGIHLGNEGDQGGCKAN
jgi:hypothetical protein